MGGVYHDLSWAQSTYSRTFPILKTISPGLCWIKDLAEEKEKRKKKINESNGSNLLLLNFCFPSTIHSLYPWSKYRLAPQEIKPSHHVQRTKELINSIVGWTEINNKGQELFQDKTVKNGITKNFNTCPDFFHKSQVFNDIRQAITIITTYLWIQ